MCTLENGDVAFRAGHAAKGQRITAEKCGEARAGSFPRNLRVVYLLAVLPDFEESVGAGNIILSVGTGVAFVSGIALVSGVTLVALIAFHSVDTDRLVALFDVVFVPVSVGSDGPYIGVGTVGAVGYFIRLVVAQGKGEPVVCFGYGFDDRTRFDQRFELRNGGVRFIDLFLQIVDVVVVVLTADGTEQCSGQEHCQKFSE